MSSFTTFLSKFILTNFVSFDTDLKYLTYFCVMAHLRHIYVEKPPTARKLSSGHRGMSCSKDVLRMSLEGLCPFRRRLKDDLCPYDKSIYSKL